MNFWIAFNLRKKKIILAKYEFFVLDKNKSLANIENENYQVVVPF